MSQYSSPIELFKKKVLILLNQFFNVNPKPNKFQKSIKNARQLIRNAIYHRTIKTITKHDSQT